MILIYKLIEVIDMPAGTEIHMINGEDYKINEKGEVVSKYGNKLPISRNNIDTCEFTIIEELKNYNFRVYRDGILIQCFNKITYESEAGILGKKLYDTYRDEFTNECCINCLDTILYVPRHAIDIQVEEIIRSC